MSYKTPWLGKLSLAAAVALTAHKPVAAQATSYSGLCDASAAVSIGNEPIHLDANRYWGGAVFGVATGFNHVHVALELSAAYQVVTGNYNENHVTVRGLTLAPASALWWSF